MKRLGIDFKFADDGRSNETVGGLLVRTKEAQSLIDALLANDLVKVLAEPTMVTISSRPASFQSGGEFPIVVPQEDENVAVEYRQFGTRLNFVPTVLDGGRIRLEMRAELSQIDSTRSVTIGDITVPGLRTRWFDTALEMDAEQTVTLCGLSQFQPTDGPDDNPQEVRLLVTISASFSDCPCEST